MRRVSAYLVKLSLGVLMGCAGAAVPRPEPISPAAPPPPPEQLLVSPDHQPVATPEPRPETAPPDVRLAELRAAYLGSSKGSQRARFARQLAAVPGGDAILLELLAREPEAGVRSVIVGSLRDASQPEAAATLRQLVNEDGDDGVARNALARLRRQHLAPLVSLLEPRIERALREGRRDDALALAREQERYIVFTRGNAFPAFMRVPPATFEVKTRRPGQTRVVVLGDFGTGDARQRAVARALQAEHQRAAFDCGITVGDNFYPAGVTAPDDPYWRNRWHALYDGLDIAFFATLGNHDWIHPDSPAAEIAHHQARGTWRMPASHYSFTIGPVQFFALDTALLSHAQLLWLDQALSESRAPWKVVYGHHPAYSHGWHGDQDDVIAGLLPVLRGRAQIYMAGHEHDMQHLQPEDGLHFFIAGGGGQQPRSITPGQRSLFAASANGFAVIEADRKRLQVSFIGTEGQVLYRHALTPPP